MKTQGGRQPTNIAVPAWEVYISHQAALKVVWEDERESRVGRRTNQCDLFAPMPAAASQADGVDFRDTEAACPFGLQVGNIVRDAVSKLA